MSYFFKSHFHMPAVWIMIIVFVAICMQENCEATEIADVRRLRRLHVRSALSDPIEESCKGNLDFNAFLKLDKICKDCFNLFKDPEVYHLCR